MAGVSRLGGRVSVGRGAILGGLRTVCLASSRDPAARADLDLAIGDSTGVAPPPGERQEGEGQGAQIARANRRNQ